MEPQRHRMLTYHGGLPELDSRAERDGSLADQRASHSNHLAAGHPPSVEETH